MMSAEVSVGVDRGSVKTSTEIITGLLTNTHDTSKLSLAP
jgi:hypothetical protein